LLLGVGRLEVAFKIDFRVGTQVVGLDKLQGYKLLRALVALKEVAFLLSWQFEQKFVGCKGFLFYLDALF